MRHIADHLWMASSSLCSHATSCSIVIPAAIRDPSIYSTAHTNSYQCTLRDVTTLYHTAYVTPAWTPPSLSTVMSFIDVLQENYNHFTDLWILSRTTRVRWYQKGKTKTNLDFLEQETVSGSGISW